MAVGATAMVLFVIAAITPNLAITGIARRVQEFFNAVFTQPTDTPYEFAATLSRRLAELAAASRWSEFLAAGAAEIDYLAGLYVHACFSAHPPDRASQTQAIHTWQRLRRRLWLAWIHQVAGVDEHLQ